MCSKRNKLASNKAVLATVTSNAQRRTHLECGEVERSERVQNNNLVRSISVDGVVKREVNSVVVKGQVERRAGGGEGVRESCYPFLEETLALRGSDWGTHALVVVEGQVVVVLVVDEVLLAEEGAECRITNCVSFVGAELKHGNGVGRGEGQVAGDLCVEAGKSGVEGVVGELISSCATDATSGSDVTVGAGRVSSAGVVDVVCLNEDFNVDLVHVLWNTEETSGKVLSGLYHTVLRLGAEDGKSLCGGEVVEELTVELTVFNTELEVLATAEGS